MVDLTPPSQGSEHTDQEDHSDQTQGTGVETQGSALQVVVSELAEKSHLPPKAEGVKTERLRDLEPPPQLLLQNPHSPQAPQVQSTGVQGMVLQGWAETESAVVQAAPPELA